MEKWIKTGKALLFPHIAVLWILLPVAIVFLVYSMVVLGDSHPISIASYVLSAYTLTIWCCRIPDIFSFFRNAQDNKYVKLWRGDVRLRMNVGLYGSFALNGVYAVFNLCLGIYHRTFWYCSLAGYYFLLGVMRLYLASFTRRHKPRENMPLQLKIYRRCGIVFLVMNLALASMIFFMVYWNRTFHHHPITTIAIAAFTFATFTLAIINTVKYRKLGSPVYWASKAISLASACVSMLTLEATMLTTFNDGTMDILTRRIFLGVTGVCISAFIIGMAVHMIIRGYKPRNRS